MKDLKERNDAQIPPFLFISAVHDTLLNPVMMRNLRNYCQNRANFESVTTVEHKDADHNDTYLAREYFPKLKNFIDTLC